MAATVMFLRPVGSKGRILMTRGEGAGGEKL
jgi:hypothetical protein